MTLPEGAQGIIGKHYRQLDHFLVGREKIREFAMSLKDDNPVYYSEAAAAYKRALAFAPNRSAALFGLALSEHRSKNYAASDSAYGRLRANWSHADPVVVGQIPKSRTR